MGRPPIGKVAMTNTERSRRYRAGMAGKPAAPDIAKCAACAAKDREIERLTALLRLLNEKPSRLPRTAEELAQAKQRAQEERKARRAAARAAKPVEIPDEKTKQDYERQIAGLRTRVRNLTAEAAVAWMKVKANPAAITKAQRRKILAALHPDKEHDANPARQRQLTEAMQIFNSLRMHVVED